MSVKNVFEYYQTPTKKSHYEFKKAGQYTAIETAARLIEGLFKAIIYHGL